MTYRTSRRRALHLGLAAALATPAIARAQQGWPAGPITWINPLPAGAGTAHHLAGELFKLETKTDIVHVPYRGAGPAMQDLLAGNADMMFDGMGTSAQQIKAGKLLGLAVATPKRAAEFPDMPTAAE